MNRSLFGVWLTIAWVVTVGISYMIGWYSGVRGAASVAMSAAHSSFNLILGVLVIVAIASALAAFKARGYLSSHNTNHVA